MRKYTYRGSRKGYAKIAETLKSEHNTSNISRAEVWKRAHSKKGGQFDSDVQDVVNKMELLRQQELSGEFVVTRRQDILAMSLEKEEHPGRVRGVGGDVTMTQYYGHSSRGISPPSDEVVKEAVKEIEVRLEAKYNEKFEAYRQEMKKYMETLLLGKSVHISDPKVPDFSSHVDQVQEFDRCFENNTEISMGPKISHNVRPKSVPTIEVDDVEPRVKPSIPSSSINEEYVPCSLFWPNKGQEVAKGKVSRYTSGVKLHNRVLEPGYVKVQVLTPIVSESPLPLPNQETSTVAEALGGFVAWPSQLVSTNMDNVKEPPKKTAQKINEGNIAVKKPVRPPSLGKSVVNLFAEKLRSFHYYNMGMSDQTHEIEISKTVMGSERTIMVDKMNGAQLLAKQKLEACHISLYIRYMWDKECHRIDHMFGFLCPTSISPIGCNALISEGQKYIVEALKGDLKMKMFLAPYNTGDTWVLMVINVLDDTVYYLDSLHGEIDVLAKSLIDMSLIIFWASKEKNKPRTSTRWIKVKCPRQSNLVDSGYYVLRYMREIVAIQNTNSIPEEYYNKRQQPYTEREIDQIRVEWYQYFIEVTKSS